MAAIREGSAVFRPACKERESSFFLPHRRPVLPPSSVRTLLSWASPPRVLSSQWRPERFNLWLFFEHPQRKAPGYHVFCQLLRRDHNCNSQVLAVSSSL